MTLRFIGWCPVCERDIKVRNNTLVHHGYQRPGIGYIVGDCPGVGFEPYETGTGAAEHYLDQHVLPERDATQRSLQTLHAGPPWLYFEDYDFETRRVKRAPYTGVPDSIRLTRAQADEFAARLPSYDKRFDWERQLRNAITQTEQKLKFWDRELGRIEGLIQNWKPTPLRTIEQETERREQSKAERDAARQVERNTKIASEVLKLQKRIDSAVRNKNSATLADIYLSTKLRALSGWRLTDDQALAFLERDDVWRAFGLLSHEGYLHGGAASERLNQMAYGLRVPSTHPGVRFEHAPLPWPPELGGGTAKTR